MNAPHWTLRLRERLRGLAPWDAGRIRDLTLSYTFHRTDPPAPKQAALDAGPKPTVN